MNNFIKAINKTNANKCLSLIFIIKNNKNNLFIDTIKKYNDKQLDEIIKLSLDIERDKIFKETFELNKCFNYKNKNIIKLTDAELTLSKKIIKTGIIMFESKNTNDTNIIN